MQSKPTKGATQTSHGRALRPLNTNIIASPSPSYPAKRVTISPCPSPPNQPKKMMTPTTKSLSVNSKPKANNNNFLSPISMPNKQALFSPAALQSPCDFDDITNISDIASPAHHWPAAPASPLYETPLKLQSRTPKVRLPPPQPNLLDTPNNDADGFRFDEPFDFSVTENIVVSSPPSSPSPSLPPSSFPTPSSSLPAPSMSLFAEDAEPKDLTVMTQLISIFSSLCRDKNSEGEMYLLLELHDIAKKHPSLMMSLLSKTSFQFQSYINNSFSVIDQSEDKENNNKVNDINDKAKKHIAPQHHTNQNSNKNLHDKFQELKMKVERHNQSSSFSSFH